MVNNRPIFFNIAIPKFAAQAMRKAGDLNWKPIQYLNNVSASKATVLIPAGLEKSAGVITTAYLKDMNDKEWANDPAIKKWEAFMKKYYPDGSLIDPSNIYGYTVASTLHQVLKQAGDNLTRENVMKQAASMKNLEVPLLIPGIKINTSATDFYPIQQEQLAKFDGERWVNFGEIYDASKK